MSQQEMVPNSEDFQYLWLENPIAQEQLQKIILQRLLRESRLGNINSDPNVQDTQEEELPQSGFTTPKGTGNKTIKLIRNYIGGILIKLGKKIQGC